MVQSAMERFVSYYCIERDILRTDLFIVGGARDGDLRAQWWPAAHIRGPA